ncbi:transposase [Rugamonas sp.]|uniref:transposase n=1 Tax=Rugamonas sp. TaxID=1926287 RepID=UPI0025DC6B44|nr:transposase [Rugamonas sp.]
MPSAPVAAAALWLSERQWERIVPVISRDPRHGGNSGADIRLFVEAVLYHIRTGTPWRDLPPAFGAWNSIYVRYMRWSDKQRWQRIFQALHDDADFRAAHLNDTVLEVHRRLADIGMRSSSRVLALVESQRPPAAAVGPRERCGVSTPELADG